MKYLIMETHPAYAVLLDENGRFLKAANLNYHVGETVQDIIELKSLDKQARRPLIRQVMAMAAAAACFCLVFFGYYQPNYMAYGTIFIRINPEVEMTVSRTERVLELDGRNADGDQLISGYDYSGKSREIVTRDLIQRAMEMGYLSNGDSVSISIDSSDAEWKQNEEEGVRTQMEEEYGTQVVIYIGKEVQEDQTNVEEPIQIVIPVVPESPGNAASEAPEAQTPSESQTPLETDKADGGDSGYDDEHGDSGYGGEDGDSDDRGEDPDDEENDPDDEDGDSDDEENDSDDEDSDSDDDSDED